MYKTYRNLRLGRIYFNSRTYFMKGVKGFRLGSVCYSYRTSANIVCHYFHCIVSHHFKQQNLKWTQNKNIVCLKEEVYGRVCRGGRMGKMMWL